MALVWNPIDPRELAGKQAFDKLSSSTNKVVLPSSDPAQPKRFILRSKGYFGKLNLNISCWQYRADLADHMSLIDLQAYVLSGKELPTSNSSFDEKIPKSTFRKLTEFDNDIYDVRL